MSKRWFVVLSLFALGCSASEGVQSDADTASASSSVQLSETDAAAVLALVNYPGTDLALLDVQVGLDSRAAKGIVQHRNGTDGVCPSSDDVMFSTIDELDAIPYVADSAFAKLTTWAHAHPLPAGETVEGVAFLGWESQAVVWAVNTLDESALDGFLDSRAAAGLAAKRPFTTVAEMGPVSYVGATALKSLHDHAQGWWGAMRSNAPPNLAGVFDSISFDEPTAEVALQIANVATLTQLETHGMNGPGASYVVSRRSYTTLAQVSAVQGVGTATMRELHDYATSGAWSAPGPFVLDAATLAADAEELKSTLVEDEGFAEFIQTLAGDDPNRTESTAILDALYAQIDKLTAPLLGTTYADADVAYANVASAAPVKSLTKAGGWTYLESIGVALPDNACTGSFKQAVAPYLPNLLFMSESDRPFDVVVFQGAGTSAPTAASVKTLVHPEAGSTAALRSPDDFFANLEPSDSPDAAAVQAAFGAQLTDVVYVAIFKPQSDPYNAEVDVYLVGRTTCGDLVGLHAIAIET